MSAVPEDIAIHSTGSLDSVEDSHDPNTETVTDTKKWAKETAMKLKSFKYKLPVGSESAEKEPPSSILSKYGGGSSSTVNNVSPTSNDETSNNEKKKETVKKISTRSSSSEKLPTTTLLTATSSTTKSSSSTTTTTRKLNGVTTVTKEIKTVTIPAVTLRHVEIKPKNSKSVGDDDTNPDDDGPKEIYVPLSERHKMPLVELVKINKAKVYNGLMQNELETYLTDAEFLKVFGRNLVSFTFLCFFLGALITFPFFVCSRIFMLYQNGDKNN